MCKMSESSGAVKSDRTGRSYDFLSCLFFSSSEAAAHRAAAGERGAASGLQEGGDEAQGPTSAGLPGERRRSHTGAEAGRRGGGSCCCQGVTTSH